MWLELMIICSYRLGFYIISTEYNNLETSFKATNDSGHMTQQICQSVFPHKTIRLMRL